MALLNWRILFSMTRGGGGGLQFDFTCRLLEGGGVVGVPGEKDFKAEVTFKLFECSDLFVWGGVEFWSWDEL